MNLSEWHKITKKKWFAKVQVALKFDFVVVIFLGKIEKQMRIGITWTCSSAYL